MIEGEEDMDYSSSLSFQTPPPFFLSIAASTALALLFFFFFFYLLRILFHGYSNPFKKKKKKNYPPIAGTIFHQLFNLHRLVDFQTEISRKHKTFRMLTPFLNYVFTVDPANVEYILKTNFANYPKGDFTYNLMNDLLGDGIFAVDGDKWRHQRKLASLEFSTKVLREYSSVAFRGAAIKLSNIVSNKVSCDERIEIQDLFMKATLDSIFKVGFGVELDTLNGSNKEGLTFSRAFDDSNMQLLRRFFDLFWKIKRFLNIGLEGKMKKNLKEIDDFVFKVIHSKIEQHPKHQSDSEVKKGDILSRFLLERDKDPDNISLRYLRDIILNFVIAGRDTTAGTLAWLFCMLCKHPDVQEKVAEEVREVINAKGDLNHDELVASLTEKALNRMHYLHACLTETLRLYPPVPLDVKCCVSDDKLPDGFDIKKGDLVAYQPYPMGRMKFLWGEEAEEYRPERWFDGNGVFVPENPFKFPAFQAGPRICLGKEFAYRQMKIISATLVYLFKFRLWDATKDVKPRAMITLQIAGGLHISAARRQV